MDPKQCDFQSPRSPAVIPAPANLEARATGTEQPTQHQPTVPRYLPGQRRLVRAFCTQAGPAHHVMLSFLEFHFFLGAENTAGRPVRVRKSSRIPTKSTDPILTITDKYGWSSIITMLTLIHRALLSKWRASSVVHTRDTRASHSFYYLDFVACRALDFVPQYVPSRL